MEKENKTTREKITDELKKTAGLLTQAGIIVGMLTASVYWVNEKFDVAENFADRIAQRASEHVISQIDPLTREEFLWAQDSIITYYSEMADNTFDLFEVRMNTQDSLLFIIASFDNDLVNLSRQVRKNTFKLDTLNIGLGSGFDAISRSYEQDSLTSAYNALQAKWRFHQVMERIRDDNAALLEELRDKETRKGNTIKRKRFKRAKFDSFPVKPH